MVSTTSRSTMNGSLILLMMVIGLVQGSTNLSARGLKTLTKSDMDGKDGVKKLDLSGQSISDIQDGTFENMGNLDHLILANNKLSTLRPNMFAGLTNLRILDLQYNKIQEVKVGDLSGMPNLMVLILSDNKISKIEDGAFADLPNLVWLRLGRNLIKKIGSNTFKGLPKLRMLDLSSSTKLYYIPDGAFDHMKNKVTLYLDAGFGLCEDLCFLRKAVHEGKVYIKNETGIFCNHWRLHFTDISWLQCENYLRGWYKADAQLQSALTHSTNERSE